MSKLVSDLENILNLASALGAGVKPDTKPDNVKIAEYAVALDTANTRIREAKQRITDGKDEIARLEKENELLKDENVRVKRSGVGYRQSISDFMRSIDQLKEEIRKLREEKECLEDANRKQQERLDAVMVILRDSC